MTPVTEFLLSLWFLVLLAIVSVATYRRWQSRRRMVEMIRKFPGPRFTIPILGDLLCFMGDPQTLLERGIRVLWDEHAPRVRFWFLHIPVIGVGDPNDLETILGNPKHSTKPYFIYRLVECFFGRGLIVLNGDEWRAHRKAITPSFHFNVLERYSDIFLERAEVLGKRLMQYCGEADFDLLPFVATTSNETICETAFGCSPTSESKADREAFIEDMESAFRIMQYRAIHPWLMSDFLFGMTDLGRKHQIAERKIRDYASNAIRSRKLALAAESHVVKDTDDGVGARQRYSFLDLMLKENNGLSEEDLLGEVRTLIAVQETSSTTLCFALLMLAMHPEIQAQVFQEVEEVWSRPGLTSLQRLHALHIQDRVLKETLRLFPPVPLLGREATSDIQLCDGKVIPSGSFIAVFVMGTHRDPKLFHDPLKFDPDRFLPENCAGRHPYAYVPFSAGPRNCIGQKYGMLQMKAVLSTLVRRFHFLPPIGGPTEVSHLHLNIDTFLKLVGGWKVRLIQRSAPVAGA